MSDPEKYLNKAYFLAMDKASRKEKINSCLPQEICRNLDIILNNSEKSKGVLTVFITSVVYKILNPSQDIRKHQLSIDGGYSGRTFDTRYITPFLRDKKFPAMAESGWLTRSLEQKIPYNLSYTGAIKPDNLKTAFLSMLDIIEKQPHLSESVLDYVLQGLIIDREKHTIKLAKPSNLSIDKIIQLLNLHFYSKYNAEGASRLPVLALYAVYQCLVSELKRFQGKKLLPIESHTSSDSRSGRIGDIEVDNPDGTVFEALEVKFDIPINKNIVEIAVEKIQPTAVERYYILSTVEKQNLEDKDLIIEYVRKLKNTHGCQMVINGVMPTLKYYLRLLDNTKLFISYYVDLLETDNAVKFEHKSNWNVLVGKL